MLEDRIAIGKVVVAGHDRMLDVAALQVKRSGLLSEALDLALLLCDEPLPTRRALRATTRRAGAVLVVPDLAQRPARAPLGGWAPLLTAAEHTGGTCPTPLSQGSLPRV